MSNAERGAQLAQRKSVLTSPSHLFFPLRQLVHARAPLLGMWAGCGERLSSPVAGAMSWSPLLYMLLELNSEVRRLLLPVWRSYSVEVVGERDIVEGERTMVVADALQAFTLPAP